MVRRPSLPLLARLNELISSFGFGFVGGCTRAVSERRAGPARDLYEDSHEKWRVFGGFVLFHLIELCGRLRRGTHRRSFTRINRYGGITTAHESNTHTMT